MFVGMRAMLTSLYGPTDMHKQMVEIGKSEFSVMEGDLTDIADRFTQFRSRLEMLGAPPIQD